ncbi:MAG: sec-independent protein translocase protein TatB [Pseudonocardiales bacterium]|nr:sec-independent protein translocase protein TatB [Pseudonocardiales bacterium]MDT7692822.1 sec-independent protein translocase protein TatB [Pseudonocardiales bacterium]
MFENVGWGEILVLVVAGLFILGPERLPEAAAWLGKTIRQVKDFASGARDQLRNELGPEFDELRKPLDELREPLRDLRGLRDFDPRRAVVRTLFDGDSPGVKPNGFAPGPGGASSVPAAIPPAALPPAALPPVRPLSPGERPPIDPDAT